MSLALEAPPNWCHWRPDWSYARETRSPRKMPQTKWDAKGLRGLTTGLLFFAAIIHMMPAFGNQITHITVW